MDYTINTGDQNHNVGTEGPASTEAVGSYTGWAILDRVGCTVVASATNAVSPLTGVREYNGISFERSEVGIKHISDGTSNTYLVGEKYLASNQYETGTDEADNETWCSGFNDDNHRVTFNVPRQDAVGVADSAKLFDSPHAGGVLMSRCDGSVGLISFDVDRKVFQAGGNRADGTVDGN